MNALPPRDSAYFLELQTRTGWGRTLEKFLRWIDPPDGCRALDVGCGPGLFPALLERRGCRAFGVDLDPRSFAPPRLPARPLAAAAGRLPFPSTAFDLVTASNLLFLLEEPLHALEEMVRVLRPGGALALLNPSPALSVDAAQRFAAARGLEGLARQSLVNWAARAERCRRWDLPAYEAMFSRVGVQLERHVRRVGPGFALWVLARRAALR